MAATRLSIEPAIARLEERGGWVVRQGDGTIWHTDDEGTAEDLVLAMCGEDRDLARRVVRSPALMEARPRVVDADFVRWFASR